MSDSKIVTLEDRISNIEKTIKELKTELSITLENFAEIREFLSELNHLVKLQKDKEELDGLQGFSLLNYENQSSRESVPSNTKLETMIQKCVSNIIKDYYQRGRE